MIELPLTSSLAERRGSLLHSVGRVHFEANPSVICKTRFEPMADFHEWELLHAYGRRPVACRCEQRSLVMSILNRYRFMADFPLCRFPEKSDVVRFVGKYWGVRLIELPEYETQIRQRLSFCANRISNLKIILHNRHIEPAIFSVGGMDWECYELRSIAKFLREPKCQCFLCNLERRREDHRNIIYGKKCLRIAKAYLRNKKKCAELIGENQ